MKTPKQPKTNLIQARVSAAEFSEAVEKAILYEKGDLSKLTRKALKAYKPFKKVENKNG